MDDWENAPSYSAAYVIFGILAFFGWISVIVGVVFIWYASIIDKTLSPWMGFGIIVSGVACVAAAQLSKAVVDNSIISWHILMEIRGRREPLNNVDSKPVSDEEPPEATSDETAWTERTVQGRGGREVTIYRDARGRIYARNSLGDRHFKSFEEAQEFFRYYDTP